MMAQRLMSDAREDPFSDSRFFSGRIRPSMQDIAEPARFSDMAMPAYATGATASLFAPGAGVTDIMGFAPDPAQPGEFLPSFGQNITQGNYLDAGLQALGGAGDVMMAGGTIIPPLALIGTTLKAPRAARVAGQAGDVAADVAKVDPNQRMGDALAQAQARYFETGNFEPPTAENPVSVVLPTETEPGIIAFHGSGADFDEFRLEMIGTGEGAQAYGYGLYFTDSEDIAKFYRNSVGGANVLKTAQNIKIEAPSGGTETAANFTGFRNKFAEFYGEDAALFADRYLGQFTIDPDAPQDVLIERAKVLMANVKESDRIPENAEEIVSKITLPERGKVYKVGLSPKPDELLDYDEFFGDQNPAIKKKLRDLVENELTEADAVNLGYEDLGLDRAKEFMLADDTKVDTFLGNWAAIRGKDNAGEELLNKYGIPGLKYRASGSRGAGVTDEAAERNYVIFDDKAVKILEKYGIVGPVLVTGGAVAATQRGGDEEGSIFPDA